jgi:drug/metabolite transporter (DMT)-like permease
VFLFGFTAILGKLISLSGLTLIFWRTLLAVAGFWLTFGVNRPRPALPRGREWVPLVGAGAVLMLHWLCFFGAIRLSNASITLVCLSSATLFTALLDAALKRSRPKGYEVLLGVIIMLGIGLIAGVESGNRWGIVVGLLSALTSALYALWNQRLARKHPAAILNLVEMTSGLGIVALVMLPYLYIVGTADFLPRPADWVWLVVLAWLCTNYAYDLSLKAIRHIPIFPFMLAVNLEPVYGVLMAFAFLGEAQELTTGFWMGSALVLASVFAYPLFQRQFGQLD